MSVLDDDDNHLHTVCSLFFSILLFFIFCFCLLREEKKFNILCLM